MLKQNALKLTVITVVLNGEEHLEETIRSVIRIKTHNIRYIVVDGGSTDNTIELIKKYENHIDYWISEKDDGLYDAMNKGWRLADDSTGILFLGAGDRIICLPENMPSPDQSTIVFGRVFLGKKKLFRSRVNMQLRFANTLHHQCLIIPKRLHTPPPFNIAYRIYSDFDFNQRLLKQGALFKYDEHFLSYALPGGASAKYSAESYKISFRNFGMLWGMMAYLFYRYNGIKDEIEKRAR
jgi:glycosyltransferase involved in cell wall biosynthesis